MESLEKREIGSSWLKTVEKGHRGFGILFCEMIKQKWFLMRLCIKQLRESLIISESQREFSGREAGNSKNITMSKINQV